jgi:hypothetical protein
MRVDEVLGFIRRRMAIAAAPRLSKRGNAEMKFRIRNPSHTQPPNQRFFNFNQKTQTAKYHFMIKDGHNTTINKITILHSGRHSGCRVVVLRLKTN